MRRHTYPQALGWGLLGLLLAPSMTRGSDVTATVTSTTVGEYRGDNENGVADDNYGVILERLNVGLHVGELTTDARLDSVFFFNPPDPKTYQPNFQLERMAVTYRPGPFQLTAGDYYHQLGRGIVLAVRKLNEAGVDVALRGARVSYQDESQGFTLFGGQSNPANIDSVNQRWLQDPRDLLVGGSYEFAPTAGLRLGTFGLYNQPTETLLDATDWSVSGGAQVDASGLVDWISVYAEADIQYRMLAGVPSQGTALYANAETRFEDLALMTEWMWLNDFEQKGSRNTVLGNRFDYNQPPTLERIDQEVANNRDVAGVRARLEYYFFEWDLLLYGNAVYRLNEGGKASEVHQIHGFTGFEWLMPGGSSRVAGAVGYRDESQELSPEYRPLRNMFHVDADWLQSLLDGYALHMTSNSQYWRFLDRSFLRGSTFVGVERAGVGGLTYELGYDTQNQAPDIRNLFHALIVAAELGESVQFRGTVGNQRGGIKCVAGVCREFPAFSGLRGELVFRY